MEIGETLRVNNREEWREWLQEHHAEKKEIWLIYHNKQSGKSRIPYEEAVEEALCFGWIDSTMKPVDETSTAQRYTPRRKKSELSELNKERVKKMMAAGKMTQTGLESIRQHFEDFERKILKEFVIPEDIMEVIRQDPVAWKHYQTFPDSYCRVRIAFIEGARSRPDFFRQRLDYFLRMTASGKKFGSWLG